MNLMKKKKRKMLLRNHILFIFFIVSLFFLTVWRYEMAQAELWKTGEELKRLGVNLQELEAQEQTQ